MIPHFHHCPECYNRWYCDDECTIEPDLEEEDMQFGAYCECSSCQLLKPCIRISPREYDLNDHTGNKSCQICNPPAQISPVQTKMELEPSTHDKDWWDRYNGIT
jgi:hypothetical protein